MSRSRIRRVPDQGRLGQLVAGPEVDSRSWVAIARVDDDPDAIRWSGPDGDDGPLGWLVDVTVQGGPLDQEPIYGCRVATSIVGADAGLVQPVERDCLVVVVIPEGNPNAEPTIVGMLPGAGCEPPATVNGEDLTEEYALATHVLVTPKAIDAQVEGDVRVKSAGAARWLGETVELAEEGAEQSYVRGDEHIDDAKALLDALSTFAQSLATSTPAPPNGALTVADVLAAQTQLAIDLASINFDRALSTKIKGE